MDHPEGAGKPGDIRFDFDRRLRLEFHGSKISSDGGLLLFRELDEVLGLHDLGYIEPPRVYWRVKLSKDVPYDTEKTHTELHG